jgi:hypothetical protein
MEVDEMRRMTPLILSVVLALVCTTASAGDLRCLVTGSGGVGVQEGVSVRAWPAEGVTQPRPSESVMSAGKKSSLQLTKVTGSDGMAIFRGLGAGDYRVTAEKAVGVQLKGAVRDVVTIPATGRVLVRLMIKRAIRIHDYVPRRTGSHWEYVNDRDSTEPTTLLKCLGPKVFNGETVTPVNDSREIRGYPGWFRRYYTSYETSSDDGWGFYGAKHAQEADSYEEPTDTYTPPMVIPDLWPQGHTYTLSSWMAGRRDPDDPLPRRLTREYTLTGFADTETPAGVFRDCACIGWVWRRGGEEATGVGVTHGVMHLAKGVGQVYAEFSYFGSTYQYLLSYDIPSDPSMPAVELRTPSRLPTKREKTTP